MSVSEIMAAIERTDRNGVDQLLFKMARDGKISRIRRGVYTLPEDASKLDKKERNEPQETDLQGKYHKLTTLTDLTGVGG
jgi:hypothetical protein